MQSFSLSSRRSILVVSVLASSVALGLFALNKQSALAKNVSNFLGLAPQAPVITQPIKPPIAHVQSIKFSAAKNVIVIGQKLDDSPPNSTR